MGLSIFGFHLDQLLLPFLLTPVSVGLELALRSRCRAADAFSALGPEPAEASGVIVTGDPKTAACQRPVALDRATGYCEQQARREAAGKTWVDFGYVLVSRDGSPIRPG